MFAKSRLVFGIALLGVVLTGCHRPPQPSKSVVRLSPQELQAKVVKAIEAAGLSFDLHSPFTLNGELADCDAKPLLWCGQYGLRFPIEPGHKIELYALADLATDRPTAHPLDWLDVGMAPPSGDLSYALDMKSNTLLATDGHELRLFRFVHTGESAKMPAIGRPRLDAPWRGRTLQAGSLETLIVDLDHPAKRPFGYFDLGKSLNLPKKVESLWPEASLQKRPGEITPGSKLDWATDIEIDGPAEDQAAIRSFLYYLRSSLPAEGPYQLSPMSLSSTIYDGHVFWDADMWFVPALAFIDPKPMLSSFSAYRALRAYDASHKLQVSWESAMTGAEKAPSSMQREIHVAGDILWGLKFREALGGEIPTKAVFASAAKKFSISLQELTHDYAAYYDSQLTPRPGQAGVYDLKNVVSPDENHTGDNDLYTNLLAQWCLKQGGINKSLYLPRDEKSFLTFEGDTLRGYKQAAAILSIYPLQFSAAEAQAKVMLERFQDKVIKNGPAMSESINALIWALLGDAEQAYQRWHESWKPFMRSPLMLFSEKRNSDRTYFTTGAAGSLQAVVYGFLGFRVDDKPMPFAAWTKKLLNGKWLSITPHLPSAWRSATFKNFTVLDHRYTLTVKREGSKLVATVK